MHRGRELHASQLHVAEMAQHPLESWLEQIKGPNALAVARVLETYQDLFNTAPGSRGAHHAWVGGYKEHIRQTMVITNHLFDLMYASGALLDLPDEEQFTLSDAQTVMFLHDIEKPFLYGDGVPDQIKASLKIKEDRIQFRSGIIEEFGFAVTPTMENALKFVEGVRDNDYVPGKRADQPLAALCHAADNLSARGMYNFRGA